MRTRTSEVSAVFEYFVQALMPVLTRSKAIAIATIDLVAPTVSRSQGRNSQGVNFTP
jgi:hypothetical protein